MSIRILKRGNIFDSGCGCLVNPVNCAGTMGAGLAKKFKERFPENNQAYVNACRYGHVVIGRIFPFADVVRNKIILNFPTKNYPKNKSDIGFIEAGMMDLVFSLGHEHKNELWRSVAIPALGCGLGGLYWNDVKKVILKSIEGLEEVVDFEIYEPI